MNADLLAPGSSVFYLRGTAGERVLATVVGLSSFPECVAINYERSGHTQYYRDCPAARLTFPIVCADSPDSDRGPSPPPTADQRRELCTNGAHSTMTVTVLSEEGVNTRSPSSKPGGDVGKFFRSVDWICMTVLSASMSWCMRWYIFSSL